MAQRSSFPIPNTQRPKQGPRALPIALVFGGAVSQDGDLELEQSLGSLEFVQSIYIDNSANNLAFNMTFQPMGYNIVVKANQQGVFPVICGAGPVRFTSLLAGAGTVKTIFFNTEISPATWGV